MKSRRLKGSSQAVLTAVSAVVLVSVFSTAGCAGRSGGTDDPVRFVDPMIGTGGHGHTFPGATLPFGMVQLSPDQKRSGWDWCSGYHYSSKTIMGFSHTHLSGTGAADYGDILFMPTVGEVKLEPGPEDDPARGYRSTFSHERERAEPGYYRVRLDSYGVEVELTATTRCGLHRYTFPGSESANVVIDLEHGIANSCTGGRLDIVGANRVEGMRRSHGWAADRFVYFAAEFSKPFKSFGTAADGVVSPGRRSAEGAGLKAFVTFSTRERESIVVRVGISAVSLEGARRNLETEAPDFDFDAVRRAARRAWDNELGRVRVEGGSKRGKTIFYTALYHALVAPNVFQDVDGMYFGMDHRVHRADAFTNYTVFSLWDTFRALHPLITVIDPDRAQDFVRSLVQAYRESGLLPVWTLWGNETHTMIGYHSVPVVVDAWMKGLRGFDERTAFEAIKHSAGLDWQGLDHYKRLGFIPADKDDGPVSKTLEYAYDDWCVARMAAGLGRPDDFRDFNQRSLFYRNVFDASTGFMRGRMSNGRWIEPFDPFAVSGQYTEANAWQYSFFAPHDTAGLIKLHGGREKFAAALDALFSAPTTLAGREQPDVTGLIGQAAHGNEPSHHVAYLYDHAGQPWKAQELARRIMKELYGDGPDGLCGNEDCGQMSAWYVFSALGFYPVTPGQNAYALGSPLFRRATIGLGPDRKFVIEAARNSERNRYIRSATFNGLPFDRVWLTHDEVTRGGLLRLEMSAAPEPGWGRDNSGLLAMAPDEDVVPMPMIESSGEVFFDRAEVKLTCAAPAAEVRYTLDGTEPGPRSPLYSRPVGITRPCVLKAAVFLDGKRSMTVAAPFVRSKYPPAVYTHPFAAQYNGGGAMALTDGRTGGGDYRSGRWQGFEGHDLEAVIDLGAVRRINRVSAGFLQDIAVWIFFPERVEFSVSADGRTFSPPAVVVNEIDPRRKSHAVKRFAADLGDRRARYLKVRAVNIGVCPSWHRGAGGKAWVFVDEVEVE